MNFQGSVTTLACAALMALAYLTPVEVPRSAVLGHYTVWAGLFEGKRRAKASAPRAKLVDDAVAATELEISP